MKRNKKKNKTMLAKWGKVYLIALSVIVILAIGPGIYLSMIADSLTKISEVSAAENFEENFTDTTYQDSDSTTATWDTSGDGILTLGDWTDLGGTTASVSYGGRPTVYINNSDVIYAGFGDSVVSGALVRKFEDGSWSDIGGKASAGDAGYMSMDVAPDGTIYVGYRDETCPDRNATVRKYNGSTWEDVGASCFSDDEAAYGILKVDSTGTPYYAYRDVYTTNKQLTVKKFDGANWVSVGPERFSTSWARSIDLKFDANDIPYVAFEDRLTGSHPAVVMKYNSGSNSWNYLEGTNVFSNEVGDYATSITFNSSNQLYVSENGLGGFFVHRYVEGEDKFYQVGDEVPHGSVSYDKSGYHSLAFDSQDNLYIAYRDTRTGDSLFDQIVVRKYDGVSDWNIVGTEHFSTGDVTWVSLFFDSKDDMYVAYQDASDTKAYVKRLGMNAQSSSIDDTDLNILSATLTAEQTIPAGSSVQYYITNDGGSNWHAINSGETYTFAELEDSDNPANYSDLRWKAVFETDYGYVSAPEINKLTISYEIPSSGRRIRDLNPPGNVTGVNIVQGDEDNSVDLTWTNPTDSDFSTVRIMRSEDGGVESTIMICRRGETSYTDTGLEFGQKYYYRFITMDSSGNYNASETKYSITITEDDELIQEEVEVESEDTSFYSGSKVLSDLRSLISELGFGNDQITAVESLVAALETLYSGSSTSSQSGTGVDTEDSSQETEDDVDAETEDTAEDSQPAVSTGDCDVKKANDVTLNSNLVKLANDSAIYLIACNKARVFPHQKVYESWGYDSADWKDVKVISKEALDRYEVGTPIPFRSGVAFSVNGVSLGGFDRGTIFVSGSDGEVHPIRSQEVWRSKYSFKTGQEISLNNLVSVPRDFLAKFSSFILGDEITADDNGYIDGTIIALGSKYYIFSNGLARNITLDTAEAVRLYSNGKWSVPIIEAELDGFVFGPTISAEEISTVIPSWE